MPDNFQYNRAKLKAVILHVCGKCPPEQLGAVKLHKVLYFADMIRYAQTGQPLTGAEYRKKPFGPTCVQLLTIMRDLEQAGSLSVRDVDYFGYRTKDYVALKAPDEDALSDSEIGLLDEVVDFVCARNTARTISDFSHQEPWERVGFGDIISYRSAYLLFPSIVSEEAFEATAKGVKQVEEARQNGDAVVFADFGNLRRRLRPEGRPLPN